MGDICDMPQRSLKPPPNPYWPQLCTAVGLAMKLGKPQSMGCRARGEYQDHQRLGSLSAGNQWEAEKCMDRGPSIVVETGLRITEYADTPSHLAAGKVMILGLGKGLSQESWWELIRVLAPQQRLPRNSVRSQVTDGAKAVQSHW